MTIAPSWVGPVAEYLAERLPWESEPGGWRDMAMSSYEFGCSALVALGYAARTKWGARKLDLVQPPGVWPRWDDICVTLLALGAQQGEISYRDAAGQPVQRTTNSFAIVDPDGRFKPKEPNVRAGFGCGQAYVGDALRGVLEALGLVDGNAWRAEAEYIFWRRQPRAWQMDVTGDARFGDALRACLARVPEDIDVEMASLVLVCDSDIDALRALHAEKIAQLPETLRTGMRNKTMTNEQLRKSVLFRRESDLDWVFFRKWRFQGGWLDADGQKAALGIFHDPLAQQMRRAVVAARFPNSDMVLEGSR